jgi:hypothetical protein
MKKEKKAAAESERMQMLAETTARGVTELQSKLDGGLKSLSKEFTDSARAILERFEAASSAMAENAAAIHEDMRHWRRDLDDLEIRITRIEKKLGLPARSRHAR